MKIVILSMFSVPTGHTKVAEVLQDSIRQDYPDAEIKIIDFLSFSNPLLEKMISGVYFKWIRTSPESYKGFYQKVMMKEKEQSFFLRSISRLATYFEKKVLKVGGKLCMPSKRQRVSADSKQTHEHQSKSTSTSQEEE